jgi:hypothetical protein
MSTYMFYLTSTYQVECSITPRENATYIMTMQGNLDDMLLIINCMQASVLATLKQQQAAMAESQINTNNLNSENN